MTAYADLSEFINRATGGNSGSPELIPVWKDGRVSGAAAVAPVVGRWTSLWQYEGSPAHGAVPSTTWANPDNTTDGGLKQTDPGGGREKWLSYGGIAPLVAGGLMVYDRLGHRSGLSGTTTTAQTFTGSLSRYTGGKGNLIAVEIYTQIGTTATTFTCAYTDQDGNSATTQATAIGGTGLREAQRMIIANLASGDTGVQAVADFDLLASTGTAGDIGVNIIHPLLYIPGPLAGVGGDVSGLIKSLMSEVETDACLAMAWIPNTTTVPQIFAPLFMTER